MRTPDQIKRKMHELNAQKQSLEARIAGAGEEASTLSAMLERFEDQILLLEWVLNEPSGKYHG